MQIVIKTPQQIDDERLEEMQKYIDLLHKQARSAERYAQRLQWRLNRIEKLSRRIDLNPTNT